MLELKCKKCGEPIKSISIERIYDFSDGDSNYAEYTIIFPGELYKAHSYYCTRCGAPIDIAIDFHETE